MSTGALAAMAAGKAIGQGLQAPPAISGGPTSNRVSIGAPVFTTRASPASNIGALVQSLPTLAALAGAGFAVYLVLR